MKITISLVLGLCLLVSGCSSIEDKPIPQRLFESAPKNAIAIFSITDIPGFKEDFKKSRLGRIMEDPDFDGFFKGVDSFMELAKKEMFDSFEFRQILGMASALKVQKEDLLQMFQGEITLITLPSSAETPMTFPNITLAAELDPKIAALLKDPQGLKVFLKEMDLKTETTPEGWTLCSMAYPNEGVLNMTPSWTVLDNYLVFANKMEILKTQLKRMFSPSLPEDAFYRTSLAQALRQNIQNEPAILMKMDIKSIVPLFQRDVDPEAMQVISLLADKNLTSFAYGMGFDRNGLVRETMVSGGGDGIYVRLDPKDEPSPPNGSLAWLGVNMDPQKYFDTMVSMWGAMGYSGQDILMGIQEMEAEWGFSLKKDLVDNLKGSLFCYAALPYNGNGHPVHFVPDLVFKAKVKDPGAMKKTLKTIGAIYQQNNYGFKPTSVGTMEGISYRRSRNRFDDLEPTFVVDGDELVFSFFTPQGAIRASQEQRPGPRPLALSDAGASGLKTDQTCFVMMADTVTLLQFGYNVLDFAMHVEREYPVIDFTKLPSEDKLAPYLSPTAIVGNMKDDTIQMTMVSPVGFLMGAALGAAAVQWYEQTRRLMRR